MAKILKRNTIIILISSIFVISFSVMLIAYPTGITGVTKRDATNGCHCHTQNTAITGAITCPDTVNVGSTTLCTLTISRSGYSGSHGGTDIAVRLGTLDATPSGGLLRVQNGELTHNNPMSFTSGVCTVSFNYIAPNSAGIDTIWSNVVAGYSNGWNWSPEKRVIVRATTTGIKNNQTASVFKLEQNYPNPFNPTTYISFSLPKESNVNLDIYDILGNKVENLINGKMSSGNHQISWSAANFSSGIYFYTLKTDDNTMTRKMILAK